VTEEKPWYHDLEPKAKHEAQYIVNEFRAKKQIEIAGVREADGDVAFMYAPGQILTREQYLGEAAGIQQDGERRDGLIQKRPPGVLDVLEAFFRGRGHEPPEIEIRRIVRDVVLITLPGDAGKDRHLVLDLLERIDETLGAGVATPNHLLTVAGVAGPCAATEPQEVYGPPEPYPGQCPGDGGAGVRIFMADTGLLEINKAITPWLEGVKGDPDPRTAAGGLLQPYDGHGTFVAGVARCIAPGAEIFVANVFDTAGSALESDCVPKLNAGLAWGADIVHLTIASPSRNNIPMLTLEAWLEGLRSHKGVLCVVAAGNYGKPRPCWPAAFTEVLSVGALATDCRRRAYFSNYGGWVDVYAPGENLVNAYATGTYDCQISPYAGEHRTFSGVAQWSGTSFSTPIVTGLIATRMTRFGESGLEAAAALMGQARAQLIPRVGPVLLPCCDEDDDCRPRDHCGGSGQCGRSDCGHCCGGGDRGQRCGGRGWDRGDWSRGDWGRGGRGWRPRY
jgi:Subtilase family